MASRADIEAELEQALAEFEAGARSLTPEQLERRCTESEVPDGTAWSPKDHVAHVIRIERAFLAIARRTLDGDQEPVGFSRMGGNQDEVRATIHLANQRHVEELNARSLDDLFDELRAARADTLAFLDAQDEATLARPIPGAPWGDGTIGGVLGRNAAHQVNHMHAYQEGLAADS